MFLIWPSPTLRQTILYPAVQVLSVCMCVFAVSRLFQHPAAANRGLLILMICIGGCFLIHWVLVAFRLSTRLWKRIAQ